MKKLWAFLAMLWALPCAQAEPVSYARQIRPILNRQCIGCHQPASKQSDLELTTFDGLQKGGKKGAAFVPGKPDESVLIGYLTGKSTPQMPFGGRPLAPEQIDLIKQWISEGAKNDSPSEGLSTAKRTTTVYHAPPLITAIAYSPDGKLLAVSGYREVLLHDGNGGGLLARLPGLSQRVHSVQFTPDGKTLVAVGGDPGRLGEVQIWDVATRKQRKSVVLTNDTLSGASISPDGTKLVFCSPDKSIRLMDLSTGEVIRKMDHHEDWVFAAVFGIDGKRIVSVGRDRAAKLIDANTGAFVENVNLLKEPLTAIARHPKKDWVLIGGQERVPYLYRMDRPRAMRIADDSTLIRKFEKQDGPILSVAISNDAQYVAVGAEVGDVHIYKLDTGELVGTCRGQQGGVNAVVFEPDSKRLVTGGFDGTVRIFEINGTLAKGFVPVPVEKQEVASAR
jgi:WD40 repeat protein